jgi:hypothetical protein
LQIGYDLAVIGSGAAAVLDLHRAVLRRFLDTGTAPPLDWLRQEARELGIGDSAVAELEAADLVHSDGGVVTVAYPFSGAPTRQQVELDGFPAVWAMCATGALGIPAMAGRDGRIAATAPRSSGGWGGGWGQWRWTPAGAVAVFARTGGCGTDCSAARHLADAGATASPRARGARGAAGLQDWRVCGNL